GSSSGSSGSSSTSGSAGSSTTSTTHEAFSLAWVPRDAAIDFAGRPAELLGRPALAGLKKALSNDKELQKGLGVPFERVEHATIVFLVDSETSPGRAPAAYVLRLAQAADAAAVVGAVQPDPQEEEFGGRKYVRPREGHGVFCFRADERTAVICDREEHLRRVI